MRRLPEKSLGNYIEKFLNEGDYKQLIAQRFFRATITAVFQPTSGGPYSVELQRTDEPTPDGGMYACTSGWTPIVGMRVEVVYRDAKNAIVLGPILGGSVPVSPTGLSTGTFIENSAQVENAGVSVTIPPPVSDPAITPPPAGFVVRYRRIGSGLPWSHILVPAILDPVSGNYLAAVSGLVQNTAYEFQSASIGPSGTPSAFSASVNQTTAQAVAPAAVGQPVATLGVTTAVIGFTPLAAADISLYEIWQFTGASVASSPPGGSILAWSGQSAIVTIGGLASGQTYTFWVRAQNASGLFGPYSPFVQAVPNQVQTGDIAGSAVTTAKMANLSVTNAILAANSVATGNIQASAVTNALLAANAVATGNIQASAITSALIAANAVTNAAIAAGAVQAANLAVTLGGGNTVKNSSFEVDTNADGLADTWSNFGGTGTYTLPAGFHGTKGQQFVTDGTTGTPRLYQGTLTDCLTIYNGMKYTGSAWFKVVSGRTVGVFLKTYTSGGALLNTITLATAASTGLWQRVSGTYTAVEADGSIMQVMVGLTGTPAATTVLVDAVQLEIGDVATAYAPPSEEILAGVIGTAQIANGAITSALIAAGAVDTNALGALAVTTAKIAAAAVGTSQIANSAITSALINAGAVNNAALASAAVATANLQSGSVTNAILAANAVATGNIQASAITSALIAANAVTNAAIAAGAVTAASLAVALGGGNLLANSSFEDSGSFSVSWDTNTSTLQNTGATITSDATVASKADGAQSCKVVTNGTTGSNGVEQTVAGLLPNTKYIASAWVYVDTGSRAATLQIRDTTNSVTGTAPTGQINTTTVTGSLQRLQCAVTTGATGNVSILVSIHADATTTAMTFHVDAVKLEAGDVATAYAPNTGELLTGVVTSTKLGAAAVTNAALAANAVATSNIQSSAITSALIAAGAVNNAALASAAVATANLQSGSVTNAILAANAVATGNIQASAITSSLIAAGAVNNAALASAAVATANLQSGSVTNAILAANAVATGNIQANAITSALLAANAVTSAAIAAGAVLAANLAVTLGGGNFLANASFEDTGSFSVGWDTNTSALQNTGAAISADVTVASKADGAQSCKVITNGTTGLNGVEQTVTGLLPNTKYIASAWVYVDTGSRAATLQVRDTTNSITGSAPTGQINTTTVTGSFQRLQCAITTGATGNVSLLVSIHGDATTTAMTFHVDAVQLETGDVATAYAPKTSEILTAVVGTSNIAALAVTAAKIAANTITAAQIAANTITAAQIQAGTITATEIASHTITAAVIAAGTITTTEIAANTIVAGNIAASTITGAKIAANTIAAGNIVAGTITTTEIAALTIVAGNIAASTITGAKIAAGTITATNILAGTITATEIAAATITGAKIAANTIAAGNIVAGTITTTEIAANTIVAGNIAAATITGAKIASGTITATNILAGTITANEIAAATITGAKIAAGTITGSLIAAGTIQTTNLVAGFKQFLANPDPLNGIRNGSFEAGTTFWSTPSGVTGVTNATNAHSGNSYLQIVAPIATQTISNNSDEAGAIQYYEVSPGDVIYFGGWAYRESGDAGVRFTIEVTDKDKLNPVLSSTTTVTSAAWTSVTSTYTVLAAGAYLRFYCEVTNTGTAITTGRLDDTFLTVQVAGAGIVAASITATQIAANTITASQIAAGTITATQIASHTITAAVIAAGTITATEIASHTITAAVIAAGTITTTEIAATTIVAANIAAATITGAKIAANTIAAGNIVAGTITTTEIAANTIVAGNIAASTITGAKIASGTITATNILAGTITANEIAASTITGAKIAAATITGSLIAAGTILTTNLVAGFQTYLNSPDPLNALSNPTFEGGGTYWGLGTAGTIVTNSANAHSGNKYLQVVNATGVTQQIISSDETPTSVFYEVNPGAVIYFGGWGWRESGTANCQIVVEITDKDKLNPTTTLLTAFTTTSWVQQTGTVTVGATGKYVRFYVQNDSTGTGATCRYDDLFMTVMLPGASIVAASVTAGQIAAATITGAKIAANTITAGNILAGTITATEIAALTIVAGNIAAGTITGAKIAANTITAANITAGTITATEIASHTITAAVIAAGTITTTEIAATTIVAGNIAAATITGAKIAANTIAAGNIVAGTITANEIATNTILAGNIAAGAVTTDKLTVGSFGDSAIPNGSFEEGTVIGASFTNSWKTTVTGTSSSSIVTAGAQDGLNALALQSNLGVGNSIVADSVTIPVTPGDIWYVSGWIKTSISSTGGYIRASFGTTVNFSGDGTGPVDVAANVNPGLTYTQYSALVTVPASQVFMKIRLLNFQPGSTCTMTFDNIQVRKAVGTANILDASISTAKIANLAVGTGQIAALAVTNAKINDMVVDKLTAGSLTAAVIMAGSIKSAATVDATHAGWLTDATSIRLYDGLNVDYGVGAGISAQFKNDGTAFFKGTVSASNVYASTVATSATIGTTGAGSGFKLAGNFLDLYTQGSTAQGTRFWYTPDSSTAFTQVGQLAAASVTFALIEDIATDTIVTTSVASVAMVIASFKPSGTPALVGSLGAFTTGTATSVTGAYGQATVATHLLVAWVTADGSAAISTVTAGWVKAIDVSDGGVGAAAVRSAIWYKPNCGAGEAAPVFTGTAGTVAMHCQLAEFSGIATTTPVDQTGSNGLAWTTKSFTVQATSTDAQAGDLILTASRWSIATGTATFSASWNNATPIQAGSSGASATKQSNFEYGIVSTSAKVLQITNFLGLEAVNTGNSIARGISSTQYSDNLYGAGMAFRKARGTAASPTTIQANDRIAELNLQAYDGTSWIWNGRLSFVAEGTIATGSIPAALILVLASSPTTQFTAFTISSNGNVFFDGPISVPTTAKGTGVGVAPTNYGSFPVKLAESTPATAASVTFSSLPTGFRDLLARGRLRGDNATNNIEIKWRMNGDTGTNYDSHVLVTDNATAPTDANVLADVFAEAGMIAGNNQTANAQGAFEVTWFDYNSTSVWKVALYHGGTIAAVIGSERRGVSEWKSTSAATSVTILASAGNITGVIGLWGLP